MKKDDALSPVVGMMMVLVILIVCATAFLTTAIPDMKESSEIAHSNDVKEAFLDFAGDVDSIYARGQGGTFSRSFTLGGGDVLISTSKSAGTVEMRNQSIGKVSFADKKTVPLSSVNVTYRPVLSYWEDQGYDYENGVVWITNDIVRIPESSKSHTNADGVHDENKNVLSWMNTMKNSIVLLNTTGSDQICKMFLVNFTTDPASSYLSGTSSATLKIECTQGEPETINLAKGAEIKFYDTKGTAKTSWKAAQNTTLILSTLNAKVGVQ